MSKPLGNVVSPMELIGRYGVDISRLAMHFTAPADKEIDWNEEPFVGIERFVNRFFKMVKDIENPTSVDLKSYFKKIDLSEGQWDLYVKLNQLVKKVTEDSDRMQFNTNIAALMEYFNSINQVKRIEPGFYQYILQKCTQLIAPLAPHFAEEVWSIFGYADSIFNSNWPEFDPEAIVTDQINIVVQVNGKVRDQLTVDADASKESIEKLARNSEKVQKFMNGKNILKVIHVPGRLVNLVVK
jgi:leucyl-tRNA synthetase